MLNLASRLFLGSAIATTILSTLSVTYTATAQHNHPLPSPLNTTDTTPHHQNGDQHLIKMMIHHEQKGAEMANLAVQKATKSEIKELAAKIKISQTQEIEQLKALYKQLYGAEVPANSMNCPKMQQHNGDQKPDMSMHSEMMNLEGLKNATNFDQEFLKRMIHHHQMSIMMAEKASKNATHTPLRDLAQAIIKKQTVEIQQLQQLSQVVH
ncbi:MAG TPA: DUF305 domain-containing protein [Nostocaceae cyanobacterium]|nr:DUF305 domain-containing protein [Nostocaceae cyanobacterium]